MTSAYSSLYDENPRASVRCRLTMSDSVMKPATKAVSPRMAEATVPACAIVAWEDEKMSDPLTKLAGPKTRA